MRSKSPPSDTNFDATREQIHRQILSAVSHDLKTPLATMIGSLEIYNRMEEKLTPEKRKILINSALHEAYRLDSFITNILDMAKFEGGMVPVRPSRTDLKSMLEDCLLRLGPQRERGEITLIPKGTLQLTTDNMMLSRAVNLLIDNAIKHAGPQAKVEITYGVENDEARIQVRDHGPGIPEHMQEHVFSKYTRLNKADQINAGTGLGLAICRQIMSSISGVVSVQNHPDGGAVFTLSLSA